MTTYTFIPIGLTAAFIVYILYLAIIRKSRKWKAYLVPGLFFIAIWVALYWLLLK